MRSEPAKNMLQQFYEIKRLFQLPLKIRLYFSTLQDLLDKKTLGDFTKQQILDQMFIKAFLSLSDQQKIAFLLGQITQVKNYYQKQIDTHPSDTSGEGQGPTINHIETSCQLQIFNFKLSLWTHAKFKFDKLRRSVTVSNKKRNIVLNLSHYLVRKSKRHDYSLVLDAISKQVSQENSKVVLFFKEQIFIKVFKELTDCINQIHRENLLKLIKNNEQDQHDGAESIVEKHQDKSLVFLSSEQITFYLKYKTHISQRLNVGGFAFKNIYVKHYDQECVRIDRSLTIDKIFKLEFEVRKALPQLKKDFLQNMHNNYKYKLNSSVIQQFSKKYKAVYDRYLINNKIYQQISLKEESVTDKQDIFFSKGVQNIMTSNHIQFMLIKVKPTPKADVNKVVLVVSLVLSKDINLQIAIAFLLEFYDMLFRVKEKQSNSGTSIKQMREPTQNDQQFFTILSNNGFQEQFYQLRQSDGEQENSKYNGQPEFKKQKTVITQTHLAKRPQSPQQLSPEILKAKRLTEHFLFKQWKRCKNGGVVCINQAMLVEQKRMIKKIFASIGSNLHKMIRTGGVLNMSLPVTIFKKQSHLQSIAMNFCYAPLLFDPFRNNQKDSLQRFKSAIIFAISVSNLGISAEKPFNPILGETLQCWIAGCPLYLQQISHHPPISSFYFAGRGYKIYGQIDPKIGMGLNSGKCSSEKPNYIQFEDGTKICLVFGKMVIKGLIFGDRQFHFEDKIYVYDMKNHYFAEIFFGPQKKGYLSKGDPDDYIYGKIYRTTSAYLSKFKEKVPPIFPTKDDIAKQLSTVEGIWNEIVRIDDKQVINFTTQLPYKLEYEQHPLPSNSTFRKDLSLYIQGDIQKSQEQKQTMEQIQRRDRKLRETKK